MEDKVKTRQQIAEEFGVCTKTLNKWMKEAGLNFRHGLLTPAQRSEIYNKFGRIKN
jgi:transposase-like protein